MGKVYRARYVVNNREVALKMLPADVTDETTLARFERELEVLKNLKHPNIVRCFGGSCENSRRFYAMELISGGTLEDRLTEKKRLPWEDVVEYGIQMCAALECSHAQGVIHRDVKPSNFLITPSGEVKLSDFGLASVAAARKITAAGKTAGTFLYMAPEQIRGQAISPQTDLYALGCVLYELVTGAPPFVGSTPAATLHMHCLEPPPRPSEKALDCPLALEKLILHLLEKAEVDRPKSAAAVGERLQALRQTRTVAESFVPSSFEQKLPVPPPREPLPSLLDGPPRKPVTPGMLPPWIAIGLAFCLLLSLLGNIRGYQSRQVNLTGETLWQQAAEHTNPVIRIEAINSLGKIAAASGRQTEVLRKALEDEDEQIRLAGVKALMLAGRNGKSLMPNLLGLAKQDPHPGVRQAAMQAASQLQEVRDPKRISWFSLFALTIVGLGALASLKILQNPGWIESMKEKLHLD